MTTAFSNYTRWLAMAAIAAALFAPAAVNAQVVVVANGSPITELDIQQRTKLMSTGTHKAPSRQEVINAIIDDRLKISKAKFYGFEVGDSEVNEAFRGMAQRQHLTAEQFSQLLERSGISPNALKARLRADLTWNQLVRGRYAASLQISDSDIADALKGRKEEDTGPAYIYTLYPVTVVVTRGSGDKVLQAKRQTAENLRARFVSCAQGLALARSLRDVAVREPVSRSSADLPPPLRELLGKMEVGRLTTPEVTAQGLQMFALCDKRQSTADSPAKREAREQIFTQRFETESKKFLEEIRKSAMIEYK